MIKNVMDRLQQLAVPRRKPKPTGPRYGAMLDRTVAWGIDIFIIYSVLAPVIDWLLRPLYGASSAGALYAAKQENIRALFSAGEAAFRQMQPALLVQAPSFHVFIKENLVGYAVIGVLIVALQCLFANTPGKWVLGLQIVRRGDHAPLKGWRYGLRYVAYLVSVFPFMLGILWIDFNKERRGWHDMVVGTVVLQTRERGWYWQQLKRGFLCAKNKWKPAAANDA